MIKVQENHEFFAPSNVPVGTFAGTVMHWDAAKPPQLFLYSERGNKFTSSQAFYQSLWDRGFRYFKYAYRGQMFEIKKVDGVDGNA